MSKDLDFKTLVADMWKKVRSTPEGEAAYQKQKKLEEESTKRFFEQIKKEREEKWVVLNFTAVFSFLA